MIPIHSTRVFLPQFLAFYPRNSHFSNFGVVTSCYIPFQHTGKYSSGFQAVLWFFWSLSQNWIILRGKWIGTIKNQGSQMFPHVLKTKSKSKSTSIYPSILFSILFYLMLSYPILVYAMLFCSILSMYTYIYTHTYTHITTTKQLIW